LQEEVEFWMQAWVDGDFKQRFVEIVQQVLKAGDHVIQFVDIAEQQAQNGIAGSYL